MKNNLLKDFTSYVEYFCSIHKDIQHTVDKKHFIRLDNDEQLQEENTSIYFPVVTMERLTVRYPDQDDITSKFRHVEMMFLDHIPDAGNFKHIESVQSSMERMAEVFLLKIKKDRRDRNKYPFLRNLKLTEIELDYVENVSTHLWGVLLSFDCEFPFDGCIEADTFIE